MGSLKTQKYGISNVPLTEQDLLNVSHHTPLTIGLSVPRLQQGLKLLVTKSVIM